MQFMYAQTHVVLYICTQLGYTCTHTLTHTHSRATHTRTHACKHAHTPHTSPILGLRFVIKFIHACEFKTLPPPLPLNVTNVDPNTSKDEGHTGGYGRTFEMCGLLLPT